MRRFRLGRFLVFGICCVTLLFLAIWESGLKSSTSIDPAESVRSSRSTELIDAKASPPRQSLPPEPSITGPNGSFGGLADNKLSIIDRYLKTIEAGNAKVSFSTDVGASYCTIIHVAAPSSEQIASARALLKNMVTQLRDGGHETIEFEQNAEKMLNSYLLYAGKFKRTRPKSCVPSGK